MNSDATIGMMCELVIEHGYNDTFHQRMHHIHGDSIAFHVAYLGSKTTTTYQKGNNEDYAKRVHSVLRDVRNGVSLAKAVESALASFPVVQGNKANTKSLHAFTKRRYEFEQYM